MKKLWGKIKKGVVKSWSFLDGKKTTIGGIILLAAKGGQAFFPDLLPPEKYEFAKYVGEGLLGLGIGHKAVKTKSVNDAIKRAQNIMNSRKGKK